MQEASRVRKLLAGLLGAPSNRWHLPGGLQRPHEQACLLWREFVFRRTVQANRCGKRAPLFVEACHYLPSHSEA